MLRTLRIAVASAFLLAVGDVAALGLGKIEVKSQRNQPLLAEIPIISTTPGELEALQARLASPETFRRVGLAPPSGAVADLQFSLGSDARGRPVIRVTTLKPVDQAVVSFLIEVDWGQGKLVREYTALVDTPRTAAAAVQPAIEAPRIEAPNLVQRPLPPVATEPQLPPPPGTPVAIEAPHAPAAAIPLPAAAPINTTPAPVPTSAEYGPVKRGESLSTIVGKLDLPEGTSLDQAMLALLRANPDAFLGDDINRLKRGAVLRVPGSGELQAITADEAAMVVREQMREWRQARRPVAQPGNDQAPAAAEAGAVKPAAPVASAPRPTPVRKAEPQPAADKGAPAAAATQPARRSEARLQIVPPAGPGKATATRTGNSAGGEGSMLQQQLRQKDEDIAAKAAEIGELKERIAELEKLSQQQEQLLSLKDSELAAAQQRLAQANAQPTPAATARPASAAAQPTAEVRQPAPEEANTASGMPWLWAGLAFLGMAVLAWLVMRRSARPVAKPAARSRVFDTEALAASLRTPSHAAVDPERMASPDDEDAREPQRHGVATDEPSPAPSPDPRGRLASVDETPTWHSGWVQTEPPSPPQPVAQAPRFITPATNGMTGPGATGADTQAPPIAQPKAPVEHRMKLARAFLDIGDEHSAKQLLREILDDVDPAAREEAARMLRELG